MWGDWLTKWYKRRIDPREGSFYKYRTPQPGGYKIIMSSSDFVIDENNIYSPIIVPDKNKRSERALDESWERNNKPCTCGGVK